MVPSSAAPVSEAGLAHGFSPRLGGPPAQPAGGAAVYPRGGDGSAAMVPSSAPSVSEAVPADVSSRALAASSAMSSSMSPSPPVRSTCSGSPGAGTCPASVELCPATPAGQVDVQWLACRGHLRLDVAEVQQHAGHPLGGVGGHAGLLDRADDGIVVAHQAGAAGPADQGVRQAHP